MRRNNKSRQIVFTKWFWKEEFSKLFSFLGHSVEITEIYSHQKNLFHEINSLMTSWLISKNCTFTTFMSKKCESKFLQIPHCVGAPKNLVNFEAIIFSEHNHHKVCKHSRRSTYTNTCGGQSWCHYLLVRKSFCHNAQSYLAQCLLIRIEQKLVKYCSIKYVKSLIAKKLLIHSLPIRQRTINHAIVPKRRICNLLQ